MSDNLVLDFYRCPECGNRRKDMLVLCEGLGQGKTVAKASLADITNSDSWVQCEQCNYDYTMGDGEVCDTCDRNCIMVDGVGSCQQAD